MATLRLTAQPIPYTSRLATLAKLLPRRQWDRLRRAVYRRAQYRCQICGREGRMYAHEIWQFNESTGYQFLRGLQALCELCHGVKHITFIHNDQLLEKLLRHFIAVNHVSRQEAEDYLSAARKMQSRLNRRDWIVSYGQYDWHVPATSSVKQRQSYARYNHPRYN